jgi:hypothetical protein
VVLRDVTPKGTTARQDSVESDDSREAAERAIKGKSQRRPMQENSKSPLLYARGRLHTSSI